MATPRTLAECRFTTGYPAAHYRRPSRAMRLLGIIFTLSLFAFLGWLLAQGV